MPSRVHFPCQSPQVAPSELVDLIRRHNGVNDVAVVGVPDDRAGELPRAYVVRKNRNVLEQDIIDYVSEHVAPHKRRVLSCVANNLVS